MPAWVLPALKAVAPHIGTIVSAARPVFTHLRGDPAGPSVAELTGQIAELQQAADRNAQHIQALAEQLQQTVLALEEVARQGQDEIRRLRRWCAFCAATAGAALLSAALAWWG